MIQELIIEIIDAFPFHLKENYPNQTKIYARKTIYYSNLENYKLIHQRILILKKLKHANLIPLVKVLEEQGKIYLIYQYIPYKFQEKIDKFKDSDIECLKTKIINLGMYLQEHKINMNIEPKMMGFDKWFKLKCYIDVNFKIIQKNQENFKRNFINQTNKIFQINRNVKNKYSVQSNKLHFSDKRNNFFILGQKKTTKNIVQAQNSSHRDQSLQHSKHQIQNLQRQQKSLYMSRSKSNKKHSPTKHQIYLASIQQKLQAINQNIKNYPKVRSTSRKKNSATTKNLPQEKGLYFNQIMYTQQLQNNRMSKSNLFDSKIRCDYNQKKYGLFDQQKKQATAQKFSRMTSSTTKNTFQIECEKSDIQSQEINTTTTRLLKQPSSKKDFEQIQKSQFKNFFNSKETYIHEFLGILDDQADIEKRDFENNQNTDCYTPKSFPFSDLSLQSNVDALRMQARDIAKEKKSIQKVDCLTKTYPSIEELFDEKCQKSIKGQKSPILDKKAEQYTKNLNKKTPQLFTKQSMFVRSPQKKQLKNRISKVIQKCDIALSHFRKQSTHSITSDMKN